MGHIRTAHERRRFDMLKAELQGLFAELCELLRSVVAAHRMMALRRGEILSHRENVDAGASQIARDVDDLVFSFAEPEHETRLREHAGFVRPSKNFERARI